MFPPIWNHVDIQARTGYLSCNRKDWPKMQTVNLNLLMRWLRRCWQSHQWIPPYSIEFRAYNDGTIQDSTLWCLGLTNHSSKDVRMGLVDSDTEVLDPVLAETARASRQQFDDALWLVMRSQEERTALNTRPDHVNTDWLSRSPMGLAARYRGQLSSWCPDIFVYLGKQAAGRPLFFFTNRDNSGFF